MAKNLAYGTGRRKTATARVFLREGTGAITVNGKTLKDIEVPSGTLIAVVIRDDKPMIPHGDTTIEPGDIIFLEGNFPFQIPEIRRLIHLMVIYLTDDPVRLKRKWKRDVDYRKSYDPSHFRNRFFVTQFLRAEDCFRELIAQSDIVVDTTGAAIWLTPEIARLLGEKKE